jgi:uridine kinase
MADGFRTRTLKIISNSKGLRVPPAKSKGRSRCFVAIVGGSGSGKSWLAKGLLQRLDRKAVAISLDDFYRDRSDLSPEQRAKLNFDNPRAIDWPVFRQVLRDLRVGNPGRLPGYDFATHCRRSKWRTIKPRPVVLVEGLWLLHSPVLRCFFDLTIFIDCSHRTRLTRRLARDVQTRGRTAASIREQFRRTVQPMHKKFVEPQKRWAAIVLDEDFSANDMAGIAKLIAARLGRFSSAGSAKRGNTR